MQHLHFRIYVSFLIISTILYPIPRCFCAVDEVYTDCSSSFDCANLKNLSYPFWGSNRPVYCGHPDFKLVCDGENAEITISSQRYQVLEVRYSDYSFQVVRTDFWKNACPTQLENNSINYSLFDYGSDLQNLTLFYGCPFSSPYTSFTQFNCTINGTQMFDYFTVENILEDAETPEIQTWATCKFRVIIPILESQVSVLNESSTLEDLEAAINKGFSLKWKANNDWCSNCQKSTGYCGYNPSSSEFTCYCRDGSSLSTCGSKEKASSISKAARAGIAAGAAAVVCILLVCCVYCLVKRRKRYAELSRTKDLLMPPSSRSAATSTTNMSQNVPSYPSSKFGSVQQPHSFFNGVKMFSYAELEEATKNFDPSMELGDGGFGTVYYGTLEDGRAVAVKRLYESNLKRVEQFQNEVEILAQLQHKNLVSLYGCTSRHSRELLLVYEYIPNGTVADHLHGKQSKSAILPWSIRLNIAVETAEALAFLHRSVLNVIHRDVKTNNILLDNNFCVKVADFGLSRLFPTDVTHVSTAPQGTPGYVDPEYYQTYQLTDKSDVYSFGVVLVELISSLEAVDISRHRHDINLANMAITKIQNHAVHELVDPSLGFERDNAIRQMTTAVAEMAFRCLQQDRDTRPSMDEVLEVLKAIKNEGYGGQEAKVVNTRTNEIKLLKNIPPPYSPDSVADAWVSGSTSTTSNSS